MPYAYFNLILLGFVYLFFNLTYAKAFSCEVSQRLPGSSCCRTDQTIHGQNIYKEPIENCSCRWKMVTWDSILYLIEIFERCFACSLLNNINALFLCWSCHIRLWSPWNLSQSSWRCCCNNHCKWRLPLPSESSWSCFSGDFISHWSVILYQDPNNLVLHFNQMLQLCGS